MSHQREPRLAAERQRNRFKGKGLLTRFSRSPSITARCRKLPIASHPRPDVKKQTQPALSSAAPSPLHSRTQTLLRRLVQPRRCESRIPVAEQERSSCQRAPLGLLPHSILPLRQLPARQNLYRDNNTRSQVEAPDPFSLPARSSALQFFARRRWLWSFRPLSSRSFRSPGNLRTRRDSTPSSTHPPSPELRTTSLRARASASCTHPPDARLAELEAAVRLGSGEQSPQQQSQ